MTHVEKIKDFIEKHNGDIFIEAFDCGWSRCQYKVELKDDRLTCWHEQGEEVFSVYENWFHHTDKKVYKELSKETLWNIGFHFYEMGEDEEIGPYLYIYLLNQLQYQKAIKIYKKCSE